MIDNGTNINAEYSGKLENPKNWMSKVEDTIWLSEMSIPGTHDSGTAEKHNDNYCKSLMVRRCCQTQDWTLMQQLEAGIRFVDIRLKHKNNDFILHHDFIKIGPNLTFVLEVLTTFLKENPTETVIMSYQQAQQSVDSDGVPFYKDFQKQIGEVEQNYIYSGYSMMQLGEARGKIVLLDWHRNGRIGLIKKPDYVENWWDNIVHFHWPFWYVKPEYFKELENNIDHSQSQYDSKHLFVSWLSANDCKKTLLIWGPRKCAKNVNPKIHGHLIAKKGQGNYGVVIMDFPTKYLIKTIVENNDRF